MKDILKDKIAGALYGVAIGDALGAPLEFMSAEQIKQQHGHVTEMIGGGWLNVVPGETTDDTAMTLAVAEGIMENPDNPIKAVGKRFIKWARSGPKDIGGTCARSIKGAAAFAAMRREIYPTEQEWFRSAQLTAQENRGRSGGNGALMRTVYPGIYYPTRLIAVETARAIAQMTHADRESTKACHLYTDVLYLITEAESYDEDGSLCHCISDTFKGTLYDLDKLEQEGRAGKLNPTGYVVDSLKCALYSFWDAGNSFEEAIVYAANLGGDADTIAAITGGLAGTYYGFSAIPERWVNTLSENDRQRLDAAVDAAVASRKTRHGEVTKINKFKIRTPDGRLIAHPAFVRDGVEVDCIYLGPPTPLEEAGGYEGLKKKISQSPKGAHIMTFAEANAVDRFIRGDYEKE